MAAFINAADSERSIVFIECAMQIKVLLGNLHMSFS